MSVSIISLVAAWGKPWHRGLVPSFAGCAQVSATIANSHCSFGQLPYNTFNSSFKLRIEGDPHEEHDFGSFQADGQTIFFKIDYFDKNLTYHSPDPSDPAVTERVITIMLADEY